MKAEAATEARRSLRDQKLQAETETAILGASKLFQPPNDRKTEAIPAIPDSSSWDHLRCLSRYFPIAGCYHAVHF